MATAASLPQITVCCHTSDGQYQRELSKDDVATVNRSLYATKGQKGGVYEKIKVYIDSGSSSKHDTIIAVRLQQSNSQPIFRPYEKSSVCQQSTRLTRFLEQQWKANKYYSQFQPETSKSGKKSRH
ncbi:hypothetical protein D5018_13740 [Parashewanella curva]|uniref:Uncharacterized protein n=1 Tax=Parashewanella curva TaxID=2338552 RepID=A0A3L8PUP9_9GAMM|nr:hypothetical protein [Parashewanella curva]RLV59131.1 hypothetical protein D5018_13740 [Parashewanella curva]